MTNCAHEPFKTVTPKDGDTFQVSDFLGTTRAVFFIQGGGAGEPGFLGRQGRNGNPGSMLVALFDCLCGDEWIEAVPASGLDGAIIIASIPAYRLPPSIKVTLGKGGSGGPPVQKPRNWIRL